MSIQNFFPNIISVSDSGRYEIVELTLYSNNKTRLYIFDTVKQRYIMTNFSNKELCNSKWLTIDNVEYILTRKTFMWCYKINKISKL